MNSNLSVKASGVVMSSVGAAGLGGAWANFTWTDLDLSSVVGATTGGVAILKLTNNTGGAAGIHFRKNGETDTVISGSWHGTYANIANGAVFYCAAPFDSNGITEYYGNGGNWACEVAVFWKDS